jgi:hypothetical protein
MMFSNGIAQLSAVVSHPYCFRSLIRGLRGCVQEQVMIATNTLVSARYTYKVRVQCPLRNLVDMHKILI